MKYHVPVLLKQSVEGLNIQPDGVYVDATFGGGGHSGEILKKLGKTGKLIAFDQDEDAKDNCFNDKRFLFVNSNFRFMENFLKYYKIHRINGLIADLGVSSHHFDSRDRGFSFRYSSSLDMRMNKKSGFAAKDLVNQYSKEQLTYIFRYFGEFSNARKIASVIVNARNDAEIDTVEKLVSTLSGLIPKANESKFLARVFQAIRIEVNHELDNLKQLLTQSTDLIINSGRLVVISYHSLEDRLVKNFMRTGNFEGKVEKDFYGNPIAPFRPVNGKVIVPEADEIYQNKRARSAKLRIAIRKE